MAEDRRLRPLLIQPVGFPVDIVAVVAVTLLINVALFAPGIRATPLWVPVGLLFVLFVPGYAVVAALFPEAAPDRSGADGTGHEPRTPDHQPMTLGHRAIDGMERVVYSLGLSVAIIPFSGLVLNFTPWGIQFAPLVLAVTAITLIAATVATVRRWTLPPEERFQIPVQQWTSSIRSLLRPGSGTDAIWHAILAVAIVVASASVVYAVAFPPPGESFSSIYLLTEDDGGELVANDYPTEVEPGESREVVVGVDNNENSVRNYTIVVVEQNVTKANNETIIDDQQELDRFDIQLAHNETWRHNYSLAPTMRGNDIRVLWLLYIEGEPPTEPSRESAEHHVNLWIDTTDTGATAEAIGSPSSPAHTVRQHHRAR